MSDIIPAAERPPEDTDAFAVAEPGERGPAAIAEELIQTDTALRDLLDGKPTILFLMRTETRWINMTKRELGSLHLPRWQGRLGPVARWLLAKVCDGEPDYIMLLDQQWWIQATMDQRRALVFHELLHGLWERDKEGVQKFTDTGTPRWSIRPHDVEIFTAEISKFGAWSPDIVAVLKALREAGDI